MGLNIKSFAVFESENKNNGILLVRGKKPTKEGQYALFAVHVSAINHNERNRTDQRGFRMAHINTAADMYRIYDDGLRLRAEKIGVDDPTKHIAINNQKTPLHWITLKFDNIEQVLAQYERSIRGIDNIDFRKELV